MSTQYIQVEAIYPGAGGGGEWGMGAAEWGGGGSYNAFILHTVVRVFLNYSIGRMFGYCLKRLIYVHFLLGNIKLS